MDTGYKSPTATGAYANTWTNPTNAYSSNDTYAIATALEDQDYQDYDFGIPEGATINGIEVSVESYVSSSTYLTVGLSYDNYSHSATPKYILMEESESSLVVGGATDTWGRDWTVSEFSNANFGSYFYLYYDKTAYIDHIKIKVYYTEFSSSSSSTSFSSSCSSSFSSSSFSSSSFSSCSSSSDSNWSSCSSSSCLSSSSSSSFSSSSSSFVVTNNFYSAGGDGDVGRYDDAGSMSEALWDTVHDQTTGNMGIYHYDTYAQPQVYINNGAGALYRVIIRRAFLPIDTSSLPDDATIVSAKLKLYVTNKNDSNSDYTITVKTFQASTTALVNADYEDCGYDVGNEGGGRAKFVAVEGSDQVTIGSITTNQYNTWTLDATGIGWINKTGITMLGIRIGADASDTYPGAPGSGTTTTDDFRFTTSRGGNVPYLELTYNYSSSSSSSSFSSSSSSFSSSSSCLSSSCSSSFSSSSFSSSSFSSCSSSLSSSSSESNSGNITFNGYDLQTATDTANTILTRNILYRHIPDKVINIKQDTIRDGFDVLDVQYSQKMISLNGWLISDSSANLRTLKNTFHNKLRQTEKNLIINDGGININYICTLRSLDVPEEHWNITQIPYNAEFLCKPFGKLTSTTTINLNSGVNVTTSPYNETISFTGSYCSKPVITFTLAGALITNMTALKLTNNTTSDWIEIARDFSVSDVLVIDCEDETVEVNGVNVDFTGVFPVFEEGSNILSIIVTATSFSYTCSLVYYPTYL